MGVSIVTLAIMTGSELSIFLNLPGFLIVLDSPRRHRG